MNAIGQRFIESLQPPAIDHSTSPSGILLSFSKEGKTPPESAPSSHEDSLRQSTGERARGVRANLHTRVRLQGIDPLGTPFEIYGHSNNFSRKGLGVELDLNVLHPGAAVTIDLPGRMHSAAVVQWCSCDPQTGRFRAGLRLLNPKTSIAFHGILCGLLFFAMLCQVVHPKARVMRNSGPGCGVSVVAMKSLVGKTLGGLGYATDSEKAFMHLQHQQRSCEEYTRLFERSEYHRDEKKRNAVSAWHWRVYHAADGAERDTTIRKLEVMLAEAH